MRASARLATAKKVSVPTVTAGKERSDKQTKRNETKPVNPVPENQAEKTDEDAVAGLESECTRAQPCDWWESAGHQQKYWTDHSSSLLVVVVVVVVT